MFRILFLIFFVTLPGVGHGEQECGNELTAVLSYDSKKNLATLKDFNYFKDEFCDAGLVEENANLEIQLFNKSDKLIATKKIFSPEVVIYESISKKNKSFLKSKIAKKNQFQNLKFSVKEDADSLKNFKIYYLKNNQQIGSGEIK